MKTTLLMTAAMATAVAGADLPAQVRIQTSPGGFAYVVGDPDRPMIGVSTRSSGKRDTLGLLVESVTRDGPAEKAGIEEGDRLVSVNGVNLRLSPLDAGEPDMAGIPNRRLVRELEKHDAGDEIELHVYRDGAVRTVRVQTVAAEDLNQSLTTSQAFGRMARDNDRAVIGVSLGGTGSRRDTLGILIVGVTDEGPAAKAGIEEGDRVATINGVDLRVAREDAGDFQASRARINRLNREMEKVAAGDAVELRVFSNGQTRTVRVEAAKAADVRSDGAAFYFDDVRGALQRLRTLESFPGISTLRIRPRGAADIRLQPRVQVEQKLRTLQLQPRVQVEKLRTLQVEQKLRAMTDALRSRVEPRPQVRIIDPLPLKTAVRRSSVS